MIPFGIKASELVWQLVKLIEEHGDRHVFVGGGDYPEGASGAFIQQNNRDPYIPKGSVVIN